MSDQPLDLSNSNKTRLFADVTFLMLKGAGYAAIVFFGLWIGIAVLAALGNLLPPESKQAPDPINRSHYSAPADAADLRLT